MELLKKFPFDFEGKKYEIRVYYDEDIINIVAFLNNYPHNGFRYHIKVPGDRNLQKVLKKEPFSHLVDVAKDDITQKRWEKLLKDTD